MAAVAVAASTAFAFAVPVSAPVSGAVVSAVGGALAVVYTIVGAVARDVGIGGAGVGVFVAAGAGLFAFGFVADRPVVYAFGVVVVFVFVFALGAAARGRPGVFWAAFWPVVLAAAGSELWLCAPDLEGTRLVVGFALSAQVFCAVLFTGFELLLVWQAILRVPGAEEMALNSLHTFAVWLGHICALR